MKKLFHYNILIILLIFIAGCGPGQPFRDPLTPPIPLDQLSNEEKDYIERFNVLAKNIRDFPPPGKNFEKYFYVFKSVPNVEDAKIFLFGETHTHSANQLWSAGLINYLIKDNDVVLFEGAQSGTAIYGDLAEEFVTQIFAVREYELRKTHKVYNSIAISKIATKYWGLFYKTKPLLALDILKLDKGKGFYWDLVQGNSLHPDKARRNETMVQTIRDKLNNGHRVFVIAGAMHIPHFEFARLMNDIPNRVNFSMSHPLVPIDMISDSFYNFFTSPTNNLATTKSIFEFLKNEDFAVFIPKNIPGGQYLPSAQDLRLSYPTNAR